MKEDVLEQLAEDYYTKSIGFFTKHNLKFRPSGHLDYKAKEDSVHSDIDLIAIDTKEKKKIIAVSCKSWQSGFNVTKYKKSIEEAIAKQPAKETGKRDDWCMFRELCIDKWTDAFVSVIRNELNIVDNKCHIDLEYVILCTVLTKKSIKDKATFESSEILKNYFVKRNVNFSLRILTIDTMIEDVVGKIQRKDTSSVENTHLSRTLQLIIASGHEIRKISKEEIKKKIT